jgi:ketosteroid isomerase-like protein
MVDAGNRVEEWIAKLEIREVIEHYMRLNDDRAADEIVELFDESARMQVMGRVLVGRDEIGALYRTEAGPLPDWTEPGALFLQPGSSHVSSNPIIHVDGDTATAETDFLVVRRAADGRASCELAGRYRDRLRRTDDGRWVITVRTGVSIARPGEEGTGAEWQRVLERVDDEERARFVT